MNDRPSLGRGPGMEAFRLDQAVEQQPAAQQQMPTNPQQQPAAQQQMPMGIDALEASIRALGEVGPEAPLPEISGVWWRKLLRLGPTDAEVDAVKASYAAKVEDARRLAVLRTQFAETITIAVIAPKGSAGKTPTARGLSAALSAARGGSVVVADMNELRGTLAMRSHTVHSNHIGHLADSADWLLSANARSVEVERCMNRQPDSYEWVVASDPTTTEAMAEEDFTKVHKILCRFYPLVILDTGNAELASSWQASVAAANLLVVPMKWKTDHVMTAANMLHDLEQKGVTLNRRVVIVGTNGPGEADPRAKEAAESYFARFPIVEIPTDPALSAPQISWSAMGIETKKAFENLGATLLHLAKGAQQ